MADNETAVAEVPVTENPPAEITPEPAVQAPVVDVAQLQAEKVKLENELRSLKGQLRKGFNQDARVTAIEDRISAMDDNITALVTELSGDPEAPNKVAAIKTRLQERQTASKKTTEGQAQALYQSIAQQVAVAHGVNLRREPQTVQRLLENDPTWAEVREMVLDAWQTQDLAGLGEALSKAEDVRASHQEKKLQAKIDEAVAKVRKEEQAKAKDMLKESGALGMPSGAAAGGGASGFDVKAILATGIIPRNATPAQLAQIDAALEAQVKKRP